MKSPGAPPGVLSLLNSSQLCFAGQQAILAFGGAGGQPQGTTLFLFSCSLINNFFFNLFFSQIHTRPQVKLNMPGNGIIIEKDKHKVAIEKGPSESNNKFNMKL